MNKLNICNVLFYFQFNARSGAGLASAPPGYRAVDVCSQASEGPPPSPCTSLSLLRVLLFEKSLWRTVIHIGTCLRIVQLSFERDAIVRGTARGTSRLEQIVGKT